VEEATPERPVYTVLPDPETRNLFMITVDEGWRSSILATALYKWAADWLVEELQGKPFAPGHRP